MRTLLGVLLGFSLLISGYTVNQPQDQDCATLLNIPFISANSNNFSSGRMGSAIRYIVIHAMEGVYGDENHGTIQHFQDPSSGVSAHYLISKQGEITQMVSDEGTAYHAGSFDYNLASIGIELEDGAPDPTLDPTLCSRNPTCCAQYRKTPHWATPALYKATAQLVACLARKYDIDLVHPTGVGPEDPTSSSGIIGHSQIPGRGCEDSQSQEGMDDCRDDCKSDPGDFWDWNHFLNELCSQGFVAALVNPTALYFVAEEAGANPSPQTLQITSTVFRRLDWTLTTSGESWLNVSKTSGRTGGGVKVSAAIARLPRGTYEATIHINTPHSECGGTRDIPVTLKIGLPAPRLISPRNGEEVDSDSVTFQWRSVLNARDYELQVFNGKHCSGPPIEVIPTHSTRETLPGFVPGETYSWQVVANTGDEQSLSECWYFSIAACDVVIQQQLSAENFDVLGVPLDIAQSFIPATDGEPTTLTIKSFGFFNITRGSPTLTAYLYETDNPNTATPSNLLATSNTIPMPCRGSCARDHTFIFGDSPTLRTDTTYLWLVTIDGASIGPVGTDDSSSPIDGLGWRRYSISGWISGSPEYYYFVLEGTRCPEL